MQFLLLRGGILLLGLALRAAADTGVSGQVTDPQGKAVPSASVRLQDQNGSVSRETKADGQGQFEIIGGAP